MHALLSRILSFSGVNKPETTFVHAKSYNFSCHP
uniref:Uncharacterized protein n=1 Tax=Arundo donax TaxID=35708 RepID=A0A0A9BWL7_ARUDO